MNLDEAVRKRIFEIAEENNCSITSLCLNSNLTPSTIFDFLNGKSKYPSIFTIKKLCFWTILKKRECSQSLLNLGRFRQISWWQTNILAIVWQKLVNF